MKVWTGHSQLLLPTLKATRVVLISLSGGHDLVSAKPLVVGGSDDKTHKAPWL